MSGLENKPKIQTNKTKQTNKHAWYIRTSSLLQISTSQEYYSYYCGIGLWEMFLGYGPATRFVMDYSSKQQYEVLLYATTTKYSIKKLVVRKKLVRLR